MQQVHCYNHTSATVCLKKDIFVERVFYVSCRPDLKFLRMRYVAAYLLAALGGKTPSSGDIEKILSSVGIEAEADRVKKIISELEGKDLAELIEEGSKKLASVPSGGGAGAAAAAAPAAGAADAGPAEEKKEEKKEESEESDDDMGFGLFD
ncbi:hypothetical protein RRG08_003004 [Elysia crispata]|uniref:Large ribosomal subunit protein P2 n=1 Tax=Elysia crispata TaxID=231223 RepID=A0AAE1EAI7_9GAST|nr:hypothetical protein RRG08_003004 [Elysia crispata]